MKYSTVTILVFQMALPKPQMRGLLAAKTKGHLVVACTVAFSVVGGLRLYQQRYTRDVTDNFYK
jgi:hypothetical protein